MRKGREREKREREGIHLWYISKLNLLQLSLVNLIKGYSRKPLINCSISSSIIYLRGDEAFYQLSCRRRHIDFHNFHKVIQIDLHPEMLTSVGSLIQFV